MLVMAAAENLEMELVNRILFSVSDSGRTMLDCNDHDAENSHFILIGCADCTGSGISTQSNAGVLFCRRVLTTLREPKK